jgi:hypothetical protein
MSAPAGPVGDDPKKDEGLEIPEPSSDPALSPSKSALPSLRVATREMFAFMTDTEEAWKRHTARRDWSLRRTLKIILFLFVVAINIWWTCTITRMLWHSGMTGSTFHLSDSVLIALVSTSIANFLALVVIIAKHLFPSDPTK